MSLYGNATHSAYEDVEKGNIDNLGGRTLRLGFIRKVLGLLSFQLALTTAIASTIVFSASTKAFVLSNPWLLLISIIVSLGTVLTFAVSERARHEHPLNLILLFTFTAAEGIMVGFASAQVSTKAVILAFAITAGITAGLTVYALRTKRDFTTQGGLLYSVLYGLIFATFVGMFVRAPVFDIAVSGVGAIAFAAYIVYDIQVLLGGDHKFKISTDDYVLGAISIYLDIINLFLHILRIVSEMTDRS